MILRSNAYNETKHLSCCGADDLISMTNMSVMTSFLKSQPLYSHPQLLTMVKEVSLSVSETLNTSVSYVAILTLQVLQQADGQIMHESLQCSSLSRGFIVLKVISQMFFHEDLTVMTNTKCHGHKQNERCVMQVIFFQA